MAAKKENLVIITKDRDSSEVRVYKQFDKEFSNNSGKLRFTSKENENADEVDMKPFKISIDELKEKQDMWLLYPNGALENKINLKIPSFTLDEFLQNSQLSIL